MNKKNLAILGLATLAPLINAPNAEAALINGVTASTNMGNLNSYYNINYIVDGSGLPNNTPSLNGLHSSDATLFNSWVADNGTIMGNIDFDLNGLYSLAGFSVWNYSGSNYSSVGVNGVNIQTSTDGTNFTNLAGAPTQFAIAADGIDNAPEQFSFSPVTAAYVRFQIQSNYGFFAAGLNEVQFNSASTAVPEPMTILGTLTALGGGAALKRKLKGHKAE